MGKTGNVANHAEKSIAKCYLSRIEDNIREAEERAFHAWNIVAQTERSLARILDDVQDLYENCLKYQDAKTASDIFYTDVLLPVQHADITVQEELDWFEEKRVLDKPQTGKENLSDSVAQQEYRGQTVGTFFDTYIDAAEETQEHLEAAKNQVEDLYCIPENLDSYLTGTETFDPQYTAADIDEAPCVPQGTSSYTQAELEAGIMESRARDIDDPRMTYENTAEHVQNLVENHLNDWYTE